MSAFQVQIAAYDILTPGDEPNVLVAMNPAALRANVADLAKGGTLIVNSDAFDERSLEKAGYDSNPLADGTLSGFRVYEIPMTSLTLKACEPTGAKPRDAERSKNFFALGIMSWLYNRPTDTTLDWIADRYGAKPLVVEANTLAFRAGYNFGETAELFDSSYQVPASELGPGEYTNITGNTALAWGLVAAAQLAGAPALPRCLPDHARLGPPPRARQAEALRHRHVPGRGRDRRGRRGPRRGLRRRARRDDDERAGHRPQERDDRPRRLARAAARHRRRPARRALDGPADEDRAVRPAARDVRPPRRGAGADRRAAHPGSTASPRRSRRRGSPSSTARRSSCSPTGTWRTARSRGRSRTSPSLPAIASSSPRAEPRGPDGTASFWPYVRDPETLARPWAVPGTPGLEHRIGGIEKADGTGNVSYDPDNHEKMVHLRAEKIAGIADGHPVRRGRRPDGGGASRRSAGARPTGRPTAAVTRIRAREMSVAQAHLRHLNPFPPNLGEVLGRYRRVLIPENNLGQLATLVRARSSSTRSRSRGCGAGRSASPRSSGRSPTCWRVVAPEESEGDDRHRGDRLTRKDWASDQEVRWCPGCGDYSILAAMQFLLPELGAQRENTVFVSGIGCAARFPYYMNTYGMHSIHGRAPAIATGLALARPDLDVWVISGDGDALSIGGNHLIHALRRNVNFTILMFNNEIYGLTKGQFSPTSEVGKVTKSTPFGSLDTPFNPLSVALGAEATFVARTHDIDRKHMMEVFRRAYEHEGSAFVEIYQNCNVFNDGAFEKVTGKERPRRDAHPARARQADPLRCRRRARGSCCAPTGRSRSSRSPTSARTPSSSTTRPVRTRGSPSSSRGSPAGPSSRRRSGSSVTSSGRTTGRFSRPRPPRSPGRRAPATSLRCCVRGRPGRSAERTAPPSWAGQARVRKTNPVRGLGWKYVDFGGIRTPVRTVAASCSIVAGLTSTAACARPSRTASTARAVPCW